jgi:hypothetical protein
LDDARADGERSVGGKRCRRDGDEQCEHGQSQVRRDVQTVIDGRASQDRGQR